ncbi:MAG TPA: CopD family protein [Gemmatimonadaceae bacterium]|nr:CopD family protein [Gemmatimonadaceae bacterium]
MRRATRRIAARLPVTLLGAFAAALLLAVPAWAHTHLVRSDPQRDSVVHEQLHRVLLVFSEPPQVGLTTIRLMAPDGRTLSLPVQRDSTDHNAVWAPVAEPLAPGAYRIDWKTVSPDGHPAAGSVPFTMAAPDPADSAARADAIATAATPAAGAGAGAAQRSAATQEPEGGFGVTSPLYVVIRWLVYAGILGIIGAIVFHLIVIRLAMVRSRDWGVLRSAATERARTVGMRAAWLFIIATLLRAVAQCVAVNGPAAPFASARVALLFLHTLWGWAWFAALAAAIASVVAFARIRRGLRYGWGLAAAAALVMALALSLSGHAVAVQSAVPVAVALDAVHIVAAGGWLGTLLVLVLAGIPAARQISAEQPAPALRDLVTVFSPVTLTSAAIIVVTGLITAWFHLGSIPALWSTPYGRVLIIKLVALVATLAVGAYNWKVLTPRLGDGNAPARLRSSSMGELALGVVILAVTAVLVATPPPADAMSTNGGAAAPAASSPGASPGVAPSAAGGM